MPEYCCLFDLSCCTSHVSQDKIVEGVSISGLGAFQLQWGLLQDNGIDLMVDVAEVRMAYNQKKVPRPDLVRHHGDELQTSTTPKKLSVTYSTPVVPIRADLRVCRWPRLSHAHKATRYPNQTVHRTNTRSDVVHPLFARKS